MSEAISPEIVLDLQVRAAHNAARFTIRSEPRRRWERILHEKQAGLCLTRPCPEGRPNLYPGKCVVCRKPVDKWAGEFVLNDGRSAVLCLSCRDTAEVSVQKAMG